MSKLKKSLIPRYDINKKDNKKSQSPTCEDNKKSLVPRYDNHHAQDSQKLIRSPRYDNNKSFIPRYQGKKVSRDGNRTFQFFISSGRL